MRDSTVLLRRLHQIQRHVEDFALTRWSCVFQIYIERRDEFLLILCGAEVPRRKFLPNGSDPIEIDLVNAVSPCCRCQFVFGSEYTVGPACTQYLFWRGIVQDASAIFGDVHVWRCPINLDLANHGNLMRVNVCER